MVHKCVEDLLVACRDANGSTYSELETFKAVLRRKASGPRKSETESVELLLQAVELAAAPSLRVDVAQEIGKLTLSTLTTLGKQFDPSVREVFNSMNTAFLSTRSTAGKGEGDSNSRAIAWVAAQVQFLQSAALWAKEHYSGGSSASFANDDSSEPPHDHVSPQVEINIFFAPLICSVCKEALAKWGGVDKNAIGEIITAGLDYAPYCLDNFDDAMFIFREVSDSIDVLGPMLLITNAAALLLQKKRIQGRDVARRIGMQAERLATAAKVYAQEVTVKHEDAPKSERPCVIATVALSKFTESMVALELAADNANEQEKLKLKELEECLLKAYENHLDFMGSRWKNWC